MFKIISARRYRQLTITRKAHNLAKMIEYAKENNFENLSISWYSSYKEPKVVCEYQGVRLEKVASLDQMIKLKELRDKLDITSMRN